MYKIAFLVFLATAAGWDLMKKEIPLWVYVGGVVMAVATRGFSWVSADGFLSIGVGGCLLLLAMVSSGRIGTGDGAFFLVSGLYLESRVNAVLFFYGLMLCSVYCLWLGVYGRIRHKKVRDLAIPFLPFLIPIGVWLMTGGSGWV